MVSILVLMDEVPQAEKIPLRQFGNEVSILVLMDEVPQAVIVIGPVTAQLFQSLF